jgi:hypothetical protein
MSSQLAVETHAVAADIFVARMERLSCSKRRIHFLGQES